MPGRSNIAATVANDYSSFATVSGGYANSPGMDEALLTTQNTRARLWTSSLYSSITASYVFIAPDQATPGSNSRSRYVGYSLRCLFP
jgi:hypothetical protein